MTHRLFAHFSRPLTVLLSHAPRRQCISSAPVLSAKPLLSARFSLWTGSRHPTSTSHVHGQCACHPASTSTSIRVPTMSATRRLNSSPELRHSQSAPDSPDYGRGHAPSSPSFQSPSPTSYTVLHPSRGSDGTSDGNTDNSELRWLFDNNKQWAQTVERQYPGFFNRLSKQQRPKYMWIGCSDSRVPASEITGLMPGEVFVHRNIANQVIHADLNLLSCLQLAVDVLKVEHVIVCGHYGCGGVNFALMPTQVGVCDNWIRHIKDVARANAATLAKHDTFEAKAKALSELNVVAQVENVCHTSIVQNAWRRGQSVAVHGWIYGVHDGILRNLVEPSIKGFDQVSPAFHIDGPMQLAEP